MAWTEITRRKYQRDELRYASDTAGEEWSVIEPDLPPPAHCRRTRETSLRDVVDATFHIAQIGCQWRMAGHQPRAAHGRAGSRWPRGKSDRWRHRQPVGQDDRSGGSRGYAAEKMIKGRRRHILTDTIGLPVGMIVHPADVQDRDGAPALLARVRG